MKQMTAQEFYAAVMAQGVKSHEDVAFRCVVCGTIQSGRSLIRAGAGKTFEDVEKYLGFSCVGRFNGAPAYGSKTKSQKPVFGCDWTLGGLFKIHKLEVIDADGEVHPRFELASPEEAAALAEAEMAMLEAVESNG